MRARTYHMQPAAGLPDTSSSSMHTVAAGGSAAAGPETDGRMQLPVPVAGQIVSYLDYSARYGFGYALAGGAVGVAFNDGSHMLWRSGNEGVLYHAGPAAGAGDPAAAPIQQQQQQAEQPPQVLLAAAQLPPALQKKRVLMQRFVACLVQGQAWAAAGRDQGAGAPAVWRVGGLAPSAALAVAPASAAALPRVLRVARSSTDGIVALAMSDGSRQVAFPGGALLSVAPPPESAARLVPSQAGIDGICDLQARLAAAAPLLARLCAAGAGRRAGKQELGAAAPQAARWEARDCLPKDQSAGVP